MKARLLILSAALSLTLAGCAKELVSYVDPFIGDSQFGHCHPCATVPFGMIQTGPQSGNCSWDYTGGYQYADTVIQGFSQNRISGTGCPDLGDLLVYPFCGTDSGKYESVYSKDTQTASPGYYSVRLEDAGVNARMSASAHVAILHFTFDDPSSAKLLIDYQSGMVGSEDSFHNHILESSRDEESPVILTGSTRSNVWVDRTYYYAVEFDHSCTDSETLPLRDSLEKAPRVIYGFDLGGSKDLTVKISISAESVEGAKRNIEAEIPGWDLDKTRKEAADLWEKELEKVIIKGTEDQKVVFYTSMYHLFLQPNNIADAGEEPLYSTLSLWDTYRAAHPLYTILAPEKVDAFVNSMLRVNDRQGFLPIWSLWGTETYCMIGDHAVPVIVDAWLKGFRGFDGEKAFQAVKTSLTTNLPKTDWGLYDKYGYFPCDLVPEESVSRTLECSYDDWCAAQMAKSLGKEDDYDFFIKRSGNWRNVYDPQSGLVRGKDSMGKWREPFDKFYLSHAGDAGGDYTEGNAWQYNWHVQHDVQGMIAANGGNEAFRVKLDSLFTMTSKSSNLGAATAVDVTGLIGQYVHGNEPCHHVAYLYTLAGCPERTQELVREIVTGQYHNSVDGLCGNDDCGQMSAWYIFSSFGFYPVNPCGGDYVIGAPQLPEALLKLPDGKTFKVIARGFSPENVHVKSVKLNGNPLDSNIIRHKDIVSGGVLEFEMVP